MVDENLSVNEGESRKRSQLSSSSSGETFTCELEDNDESKIKNESNMIGMYDIPNLSPESVNFHVKVPNEEKNNTSEKKVHWNPSQVHALLDCIEKRMGDFRRKSVHKSVWLSIGKEMLEHGDFTVEHCYNKWKNLRRDIRLFTNSTNMQKLSIRNAFIMERVQKMVNEIGYECSSSRKSSSSPISPNIDIIQPNNSEMHIQDEIMEDLDNKTGDNHDNKRGDNSSVIEETIISLLSDPSVSQAILSNPKLIEEIIPGIDITGLIHRIIETRPDLIASSIPPSISHQHSSLVFNNSLNIPPNINNSNATNKKLPQSFTNNLNNNTNNNNTYTNSNSNTNSVYSDQLINHSLSPNNPTSGSWPQQLYELLHSFRDEESRQMQRLDQIVNYVHIMQDSTKRRLNTINQLLSLAGLLIPQK